MLRYIEVFLIFLLSFAKIFHCCESPILVHFFLLLLLFLHSKTKLKLNTNAAVPMHASKQCIRWKDLHRLLNCSVASLFSFELTSAVRPCPLHMIDQHSILENAFLCHLLTPITSFNAFNTFNSNIWYRQPTLDDSEIIIMNAEQNSCCLNFQKQWAGLEEKKSR